MIALSYLVGGIPVGVLLARSQGVDLRQQGSGNIGATNVLRVLGVKFGLLAFACDVLKGALPVLAAGALGSADWTRCGCGVAAVIGHCYSPYLRLAGGKAVATGLGVLLAFNWVAGLIAFGLWALLTALTRYVSLASMLAYVAALALVALLGDGVPVVPTVGFLIVLSIYRHSDNIGRLLAGTESKIGTRKPRPTGEPAVDQPEGGDDE